MKYLLLFLSLSSCFADNSSLFNQAYQAGKQNQFTLNLNQNSNINSYGQANHFESTVANNANTGNVNAQSMYNNTYGDNANPNYLYNTGIKDIAACQTKSDPRCTTLNKYGDKDTQTQLQAYNQGISTKYYISVKPDQSDSSCSTVTRKVPINQSTVSCIASSHTQTACNSMISISLDYHDCDSSKGQCNNYQNNPDCKMVRPFIQGACHYDCDSSWHGGDSRYCPWWQGAYNHDNNWVSGTCTIGQTYFASAVGQNVVCGTNIGGGSPNWHVWFNGCTPPQLASYACKVVNYNDGCSGLKK
jgi:hypothetical protein